jgi:hypothetical protein
MIKKNTFLIFFLFYGIILISCNGNQTSYKNKEINNVRTKSSGFYFVGMKDSEPSIYQFHFDSLNYSLVWHKEEEGVTELSYSLNRKNVFFVTVKAKGKNGLLPFIDSVNIYSLEPDSNKIYNLESLGNGIQVFTYWKSNSSFGIVMNSFDKVHSNTIINRKVEFNVKGIKTTDQKKFYDIVKQGYPSPEVFSNDNFSNGRYLIDTTNGKLTSIFLIDNENKDTALVTTVDQKLNRINWSNNGKYLIFSTIDISPRNETLYNEEPSTSKIFIYCLENKTLAKVFEGSGIKNFFLYNNWVIFDDGFREKSEIMIYNYITNEMVKEIKIKDGCGLENIPAIPDYSA